MHSSIVVLGRFLVAPLDLIGLATPQRWKDVVVVSLMQSSLTLARDSTRVYLPVFAYLLRF